MTTVASNQLSNKSCAHGYAYTYWQCISLYVVSVITMNPPHFLTVAMNYVSLLTSMYVQYAAS